MILIKSILTHWVFFFLSCFGALLIVLMVVLFVYNPDVIAKGRGTDYARH